MFYNHKTSNGYFDWMRTVTKEEAEITIKNMEEWAKKPVSKQANGELGEWVYGSPFSKFSNMTVLRIDLVRLNFLKVK